MTVDACSGGFFFLPFFFLLLLRLRVVFSIAKIGNDVLDECLIHYREMEKTNNFSTVRHTRMSFDCALRGKQKKYSIDRIFVGGIIIECEVMF